MKNCSYIILLENGRPKGYANYSLDDPVHEIRSLDPTLEIIENIYWFSSSDSSKNIKEAIEVFVYNAEQNRKIKEYAQLRNYYYLFFYENEERTYNHIKFDYSNSRKVGHILFAILQMVRAKHTDLSKISKSGFVIHQKPLDGKFGEYRYSDGKIIGIFKNGHEYQFSKGIDDELNLEEDGLVIQEFYPKFQRWLHLRNPYIPYEVGTYTIDEAMKYTNGIKPDILQ